MIADETLKILAILKAAYPHSFKDLTKRDAEAMIDLWTTMFAAESYEEVNAAVAALISTRAVGFSPTIGEVKEKLHSLKTVGELSEQEAWAMVAKACCGSPKGYHYLFDKLPVDVQRAVGSPDQLREWGMIDTETLQSVVASNFMRSFRTMRERNKEWSMLPQSVQKMLTGITGEIKMIEGGAK